MGELRTRQPGARFDGRTTKSKKAHRDDWRNETDAAPDGSNEHQTTLCLQSTARFWTDMKWDCRGGRGGNLWTWRLGARMGGRTAKSKNAPSDDYRNKTDTAPDSSNERQTISCR